MKLSSLSFIDGETIPERYALSSGGSGTPLIAAENLNPHLAWDDVPEGTASFALLCADLDAVGSAGPANQAGRTADQAGGTASQAVGTADQASGAADQQRLPFYHWVLVDLPGSLREIDEGAFASMDGDTAMPASSAPPARRGQNDYAGQPSLDAAVSQNYGGPAPPSTDTRLHRYRFTLYALSVPTLDLPTPFRAADVLAAIQGNTLAEASLTGIYTLNPALAPTQIGSPTAT